MTYYLFTTLMAVIIGIILVVSIHPGDPTVKDNLEPSKPGRKIPPKTLDAFLDLIRNIFPVNLISSCFRQASTFYVSEVEKILLNGTLKDVNITNIRHGYQDATNILGFI
uniref:Amino acid transporter n=1 Tax=Schmidtea mediterranea TaxID=79327 RepID=A0A0H3YIQ3_SCHMD|nr:slc1a-1 [Schmidtea mediterranea]